MAQVNSNLWNRYKYKLNGLIIILPFYFLYQSLFPVFPTAWNTKKIASFEITPTPFNAEPPYLHDGSYAKDFVLTFTQGNIEHIRQAYVNIGNEALPLTMLQKHSEGIVHGNKQGQEVHAIAPNTFKAEHKMWLTIENWQGEKMVTSWDLPKSYYSPKI